MTVVYKTYEEAEEFAVEFFSINTTLSNGIVNAYAIIYRRVKGYTILTGFGGCHGWLSYFQPAEVVSIFTSTCYKAMDEASANEYWDWMVGAESPWRQYLATLNHKFLHNKAGQRVGFGFYGKLGFLVGTPVQPLANIFVATRTPLEKYGYLPMYNAAKETKRYTDLQCRYIASIAQYKGIYVKDVDGYHFPFNFRASTSWSRFSTGDMDIDTSRTVGTHIVPVNSIWGPASESRIKLSSDLLKERSGMKKEQVFELAVEQSMMGANSCSLNSFLKNLEELHNKVFETGVAGGKKKS